MFHRRKYKNYQKLKLC